MRIERIVARSFGPFRDRTVDFAPGLTVVGGPNEAGKTSLHAALRAAITGVRRSRGRATLPEAEFAALHRPWDRPDDWSVEARLVLADGRRIELVQDLAAKVASRAIDLDLGTDVSSEIIREGSPDGSAWLGLDRDAFAATVSVDQAGILAVAEAGTVDHLQEHLQRAAATRGTDATAAEAIDRLADFRRLAVGADRAAAKGPLRVARIRLAEAEQAVDDARRRHDAYLILRARIDAARVGESSARAAVQLAEAEIAERDAAELRRRSDRANELAARYPEPPTGLAARDELADAVAGAISAWEAVPPPPDSLGAAGSGQQSSEIAALLEALPTQPAGETRPDPDVVAAAETLRAARAAADLLAIRPRPAPAARAEVPGTTVVRVPIAAAGLFVILAVVAIVLGSPLPGVGLLAIAGLLTVVGLASRFSSSSGATGAMTGASESDERSAAAADREGADRAAADRVAVAEGALAAGLSARGVVLSRDAGDLEAAYRAYLLACEQRATQARAAEQAPLLRQALEAQLEREQASADARRRRVDAETGLRTAAQSVGREPGAAAAESVVHDLRAWQRQRATELDAGERSVREWQQLQGLLEGGTLADLARRAELADQLARAAAAGLPANRASPHDRSGDPNSHLRVLRATLDERARDAEALDGRRAQLEESLASVSEAEEELGRSRAELERIEALSATVGLTLELLQDAQARVHRDLAPVLAGAIRRWLPAVTGGRYEDVAVNPADLAIQVKEVGTGQWREARRLSHGAREQVYLLLRAAMAEHLVRPGEVAPLLLDEVTAQSDSARKTALLETIHTLSRDRQVILFTHDEQVVAWAAGHLLAPNDALVELPAP